jgi:uncharacterized protein
MGSENLHEDPSVLSDETKNVHRAIVSLMEELEAVEWYGQRAEACTDDELRAVLVHNKNEEIEHAMMTLEWLRRRHPVFADNIATYLNSTGPITAVETAAKDGGDAAAGSGSRGEAADVDASASTKSPAQGSLGIGSLKGK